ncbi:MAG: glycoside hydrolase family 5 protein [Treponema sp.]|nr:glycoside hydrolase family 5 protein [Treponema sp.]
MFVQKVVSESKDTSEVTLYDITIENSSKKSGSLDESENESDNETDNESDNESNEDSEVDENIKFESDDVFTSERTFDFISDMQIGWNLGNALDANNNGVSSETAWGNPKITQTLLTKVKEAGFQVVRIPITWLGHIGNAPNYTIEESFLDRVSEVVGYAKNAGLKAIINIHHDGADSAHWLNIKDAATNSTINTAVKNQLYSMWTQIAKKFPNSEDYLIFETMNEIHDGGWGWGTNRNDGGKQYNTLNEWNKICVDAIRNTGAKNFISIPGYVTDPTLTMDYLVLPNDELNKLFVTVHFYEPDAFTLKAIVPKWGKTVPESELKYDNPYEEGTLILSGEEAIDSMYKKLNTKYIRNGIPVLVSECGATHQAGYENYRRYYTEYMVKSAHNNGLVPILWDNGSSGSGRESSGLFDRRNGEIYSHAKTIVEAAIKAATTEYSEIELP